MVQAPIASVEGLIDLLDQVRRHVNEPRIHASLFSDQPRYFRACSAMDMIGDNAQALRSYLDLADIDPDKGTSYLVVFGALQVLYVQQDSVFWLCQCLGFPRDVARLAGVAKWIHGPGNARLAAIRSLRNSTAGHPVWRDKGPVTQQGSSFISQMSVSPSGFTYSTTNTAGAHSTIHVNIPDLVRDQVDELEAVLKRALDEITDAERKHRERFKGQRLEMTFAGLSHPLEKMHEAVRDERFRPLGLYGTEAVAAAMQRFSEKLQERGEQFGNDLDLIYGQLKGALSRLTEFYNQRDNDRDLADILATFVGDRINDLREWARSLDEDYVLPSEDGDSSTSGRVVSLARDGSVPDAAGINPTSPEEPGT